jgi:hypothetical protein
MCAKILVGKPGGNRPLRRPSSRWGDNIKMDFVIGLDGVDWIHLAQDRNRCRDFVNTVMNLLVP